MNGNSNNYLLKNVEGEQHYLYPPKNYLWIKQNLDVTASFGSLRAAPPPSSVRRITPAASEENTSPVRIRY